MFYQRQRLRVQRLAGGRKIRRFFEGDQHFAFDIFSRGQSVGHSDQQSQSNTQPLAAGKILVKSHRGFTGQFLADRAGQAIPVPQLLERPAGRPVVPAPGNARRALRTFPAGRQMIAAHVEANPLNEQCATVWTPRILPITAAPR